MKNLIPLIDKFRNNTDKENKSFIDMFKDKFDDLKDSIVGTKESIITSLDGIESNTSQINSTLSEIERIQADTSEKIVDNLDIIRDDNKKMFEEIKNSIGSQEILDTGKDRDKKNFLSIEEKIQKDTKRLVGLSIQQVKMISEQLVVLKDIKQSLMPKIPPELEEQRSTVPNLFALQDNQGLALPDFINRKKTQSTPQKKNHMKSAIGRAFAPLAIIGSVGASSYSYNELMTLENEREERIHEIERLLETGRIDEKEAQELILNVDSEISEKKKEVHGDTGSFVGGSLGLYGGAKTGAALGSVFGPVGTIGGAIVGGIAGTIGGSMAGEKIGESVHGFLESDKTLEDVYQEKKKEYSEKISEIYKDAKDFIESDEKTIKNLFSEKINSIKESFSLENIKSKFSSDQKNILEPETESNLKIEGNTPTQYINKTDKEISEITNNNDNTSSTNTSSTNIISNNNTTHNNLKPTPRMDNNGSALDHYISKTMLFG